MANSEPDSLNIPAFMRKKGLNERAKDKLFNTAYDYKQAGKLIKLAKEVARTRPLLKAKPLRRATAIEFNAFGETPIKKQRKKRAIKKSKSFDMPLIGFSDETEAANMFQEPQTVTPEYERETSPMRRIVPIGTISDYLERIEVGIIELEGILREGEIIQIECGEGMFQQKAESIQINRKQVRVARKGASIGLKLADRPEIGGRVFKIV